MTLPSEAARLAASARVVETRRTDGARIVWRLWPAPGGARSPGRRFLLLHGSYGSWTHWVRNIAALNALGEVVAVDAPGFGDSEPPPESTGPQPMAQLLAHGWHALQPELAGAPDGTSTPLVIAGFSLGASHAGCLARALMADRQGAVAALVLLAPGGLGPRAAAPGPVQRILPGMTSAERLAVHRHNLAVLMLADAACIDDAALLLQASNVAACTFRGAFVPSPDTLLQALPGLVVPVLAIWGARDQWDPDLPSRQRALLQVAPQADTRVVPDAGHWVGYQAAEAVNQIVERWLDSL